MSASPSLIHFRSGTWRAAPPWLVITLGVTFALIWSSSFSVAKIVVAHTPPFSVSAARFFFSAVLAGLIALACGQRLPRGARAWRSIIILGLCQNTIYLGMFFTAMTRIQAAPAAIIASSLPLIVTALASVMANERIGMLKAGGLITGFAGVVWIMGTRAVGGIDLVGVILAIIGVLALATATLTVRLIEFETGLLMVVACQMLVGSIGCLPIALLFEDVTAFDITGKVALAFAYQVAMPGIVATLLWFTLVKMISAAGASAFHFLNPLFGVVIAHAMLGESVSLRDGGGVALVAAGILAVTFGADFASANSPRKKS